MQLQHPKSPSRRNRISRHHSILFPELPIRIQNSILSSIFRGTSIITRTSAEWINFRIPLKMDTQNEKKIKKNKGQRTLFNSFSFLPLKASSCGPEFRWKVGHRIGDSKQCYRLFFILFFYRRILVQIIEVEHKEKRKGKFYWSGVFCGIKGMEHQKTFIVDERKGNKVAVPLEISMKSKRWRW